MWGFQPNRGPKRVTRFGNGIRKKHRKHFVNQTPLTQIQRHTILQEHVITGGRFRQFGEILPGFVGMVDAFFG